ncbi:MAG: hypothetical protein ACKVRN_10245 [Pyrinomonadaceae bacterium]
MDWSSLQPENQNYYNIAALVIAICLGGIGAFSNAAFDSKRNYDAIKLFNEIITRSYLAQAGYFVGITLLVTKSKPMGLLGMINPVLAIAMFLVFLGSNRWTKSNNKDARIMNKINCEKNAEDCQKFKCKPTTNLCKKELDWIAIRKIVGGHYIAALIILIINMLISLSPITR